MHSYLRTISVDYSLKIVPHAYVNIHVQLAIFSDISVMWSDFPGANISKLLWFLQGDEPKGLEASALRLKSAGQQPEMVHNAS